MILSVSEPTVGSIDSPCRVEDNPSAEKVGGLAAECQRRRRVNAGRSVGLSGFEPPACPQGSPWASLPRGAARDAAGERRRSRGRGTALRTYPPEPTCLHLEPRPA